MGAKLDQPIADPWLSLNGLQDGDTAVWVGSGQRRWHVPDSTTCRRATTS